MQSERVTFSNAEGETLSGVIEAPDGDVRAWAIFAHCFTCSKKSLAASRVARGLAAQGIGVLRFSNGPVWKLHPNFQLGAYGDIIYIELPAGNPTQEYRLNLEPLFKGKWGEHLSWGNRSRIEYRIFPEQAQWRFRNQSRVNFDLGDIQPFLANEVFFAPHNGFNHNRARAGLAFKMGNKQRLELAYMARWRKSPDENWSLDHIATLFIFFTPEAS